MAAPRRSGRLLLPALPLGRAMPWVLAAVAAVIGATGLLTGDTPLTVLGAAGLFAVLVAFPGAHLLLGRESEHGDPPEPPPPPGR